MMSQAINEEQKERSLHALNPMVLLALIVFLCFLASYIVPAGEYARILDPVIDKEIVDPASFSYVQQKPISFFFLLQSLHLTDNIGQSSSNGACCFHNGKGASNNEKEGDDFRCILQP